MSGAVLGFALVFVVTALVASAAAGIVVVASGRWAAARGPLVERRVAELAAIAPVAAGAVAVSALIVQNALGVDHCVVHQHHAHLCFAHGALWSEKAWVAVTLAIAASVFIARVAIALAAYVRGARSIRALAALGELRGDVRVVASERPFCFVARRGVFVSSRVWRALAADERAAMIAHERAHVARGDLVTRGVLEALLVFAAPLVGSQIRTRWLRATERLCDADAAAAVGDAATVARAMVAMCRLGRGSALGLAFPPSADELAGRIRAVLAGGPLGERFARRLAAGAVVAAIVFAIAGLAAASPVHHAFETLLG